MQLENILRYLNNISILYVEDDDDVQKTIVTLLHSFTQNVYVASNGRDALEIFGKEEIELIITDISMPIMDSVEFVTKIRDISKKTPIAILTSYNTTEYLLPLANLNIQAYILKPISYDKLTDALENIINYLDLDNNRYDIKFNDNISYNTHNGILTINNKTHNLNKKEHLLLNLLIKNKNNMVSYEKIEQDIWSSKGDIMTNTALRTVIKNLRKKLTIDIIENISGFGYKIVLS